METLEERIWLHVSVSPWRRDLLGAALVILALWKGNFR